MLDLASAGNRTFSRALLDIHTGMHPAPLDYSPLPLLPQPTTIPVTKMHEKAENYKFKGPSRDPTGNSMTGKALIAELVSCCYLLLPCTVDSLGLLGPIYSTLLVGDSTSPHLKRPPNIHYGTGLHSAARAALSHITHADCPTGLLAAADAAWRQTRPDDPDSSYDTWFTHTYHATTPSHWATQVLGYNITQALAYHFYAAERAIARRNDRVRSNITRAISFNTHQSWPPDFCADIRFRPQWGPPDNDPRPPCHVRGTRK